MPTEPPPLHAPGSSGAIRTSALTVAGLDNGRLRVAGDPSRGGRIVGLSRADAGDEWIFFDPARGAGLPADHPVYDDVWQGGFEELFPNDAAGKFDGRALPDHGELWKPPFEVVRLDGVSINLRRRYESVPVDVDKVIALEAGAPALSIHYHLANRSSSPVWHLFKLHPAVRVEPGDLILLRGARPHRSKWASERWTLPGPGRGRWR